MTNFKMTRQEQKAVDFGMNYFPNGYSSQVVYDIYENNTLIKRHISTKEDKVLFATITITNNNAITDIRFHENKAKKFKVFTGEENILLSI